MAGEECPPIGMCVVGHGWQVGGGVAGEMWHTGVGVGGGVVGVGVGWAGAGVVGKWAMGVGVGVRWGEGRLWAQNGAGVVGCCKWAGTVCGNV